VFDNAGNKDDENEGKEDEGAAEEEGDNEEGVNTGAEYDKPCDGNTNCDDEEDDDVFCDENTDLGLKTGNAVGGFNFVVLG
jgi:hypothetical protein